jgi:vacuolar iron transporter family protein
MDFESQEEISDHALLRSNDAAKTNESTTAVSDTDESPPSPTSGELVREGGTQETMRPLSVEATRAQSLRHLGQSRQYWRDIILGVNDGLVSTFLLVSGVSGGGLNSASILLTAISGALAGAISMAAGEYIATKSQNEVLDGELSLEGMHIRYCMGEELEELKDLLALIGIDDQSPHLQSILREHYQDRPEALLKIMTALEFGVVSSERRSPILACLTSGVVFVFGALPSVVPFAFSGENPIDGLVAAAVITITCLLVVGAIKAWATRGKCFRASAENLMVACVGGGFAYGIGVLFEVALR